MIKDSNKLNNLHGQGRIRGVKGSWAALSTCEGGINGVVFDGLDAHHIEQVHQAVILDVEQVHWELKGSMGK